MEAKIRLSGNAVESVAIAMVANPALDPDQFSQVARRARGDLAHVNALQWAPRVRRERVAAFERSAESLGLRDYRVFDVTPDFQPTELADREEYFPVLYDERSQGQKRVLGLALGRYDGRRIPMETARDEGRPVATLPVRPIGPATPQLVYLLFWPVYDSIDVPATIDERRARLSGFAVGNYNLAALLTAAIRDTPQPIETIRFSVTAEHQADSAEKPAVIYSPATGSIQPAASDGGPAEALAVRIERDFAVFDQHWDLTFDFAPSAVAGLRSNGSWGWLLAGLLLTASLVFYLLRERGRTEAIEALVARRTAELERTSEQLRQAQKMESIGQLTGGVAHDFNNLLTVVIGTLDSVLDRARDDVRPAIDSALKAAERGAALIRQMLAFSRRQVLNPQSVDINDLAGAMEDLLRRTLGDDIEIEMRRLAHLWPATADKGQVENALLNLAINARDAMPSGGKLTIETGNVHLDREYAASNAEVAPGDYVIIAVTDTGRGMPPDVVERAVEPFFTTKAVGKGSGLGLSMIYGFAKQSGGHLKIYSEVGHGTTVRLYLPRRRADTPIETMPDIAHADHPPGGESILVVEDDELVRGFAVSQLQSLGYRVMEAADGPNAQKILDSDATIDLMLTDVVMPGGMTGRQLAEAAQRQRPALRILYTSGYTEDAIIHQGKLDPGVHFLSKPFRRQDLATKIREVLDAT
jgi:signal transduction histidine kinase